MVQRLAPLVALAGVLSLARLRAHPTDPVAWWGTIALILLATGYALAHARRATQLEGVIADRADELAATTTELKMNARFFRSIVKSAAEVVVVVDAARLVRYATPATEGLFGIHPTDGLGTDLLEVFAAPDVHRARELFHTAVRRAGHTLATELRLADHLGDGPRRVELTVTSMLSDPAVGGIIVNAQDVTDRRALEEQLAFQAYHDPLTGLPNRRLFQHRMAQAVDDALVSGHHVAVLFLDLDDFKAVNDGLGHRVGDALLGSFAARISGLARAEVTFARLGGDEFALLVSGLDRSAHAAAEDLAAAIHKLLARPFDLDGRAIVATASIGIATTATSPGVEELQRDADLALYRAKDDGKSCTSLFRPSMHAAALNRVELQSALGQAMECNHLSLAYQPLFDLRSGTLSGVEALLRWEHPHLGFVPPSEFVPLAEATGLILPIGQWVLREACRQGLIWHQEFGPDAPTVSVNLSGCQLAQPTIVADLATTLATSGLPSHRLVLELTESMLIDNAAAIDRLHEIRKLGIRLALDDFGTGYSSLSYLQKLPINSLKIDRSFVTGVTGRGRSVDLLRSIIDIGRALGLTVVAEGIESDAELEQLRRLGCAVGQGYLLCRPSTPEAISTLLRDLPALRAGCLLRSASA